MWEETEHKIIRECSKWYPILRPSAQIEEMYESFGNIVKIIHEGRNETDRD